MKNKKKNPDSDLQENRKRLFMRIKSPSAFGAARRFDSVSFMNVPPEIARRDAAFSRLFDFMLDDDFPQRTPEERSRAYQQILNLLSMIEYRTRFIRNAEIMEKRSLERIESLTFIGLLQNKFLILNSIMEILLGVSAESEMIKLIQLLPEKPTELQREGLKVQEQQLIGSVRSLIAQVRPRLLAQREERCKLFSKSDSERYERSYAFYLEYYNDLKNV